MSANGDRLEACPTCGPIGMMAWRIGHLLDLQAQLAWIQAAGFDAVGFHAAAGVPGQWQGMDPAACRSAADRARLRDRLRAFATIEIHAPFALTLRPTAPAAAVLGLEPVLEFAGSIGAAVVTLHAEPPPTGTGDGDWGTALERLEGLASGHGLRVGLETSWNFAAITKLALPHVGVTLDVGHLYHHGRAPLVPFGTPGAVVRHIGRAGLAHLHLHDVRAGQDHVEVTTGEVDWASLFLAVQEIGYAGAFCLELNPDLVPPDGIRRSLAAVRTAWADARNLGARPGSPHPRLTTETPACRPHGETSS